MKAIFYQDTRCQAEQPFVAFCARYEKTYCRAAECLQKDHDTRLTLYDFPQEGWKTIRTTNVIERLFSEAKKRSHKMSAAFRNEDSCLLMCYVMIRGLQFKRVKMTSQRPVGYSAPRNWTTVDKRANHVIKLSYQGEAVIQGDA